MTRLQRLTVVRRAKEPDELHRRHAHRKQRRCFPGPSEEQVEAVDNALLRTILTSRFPVEADLSAD